MKKLYKYFFKVSIELKIILVLAILCYFSIELWLNNYKEIFHGANKIGQFFSSLSISYISAFIFYFVVVHLKNEKDKENINEYIGIKVFGLITSAHLFIQPFQQIKDKKARFEDLKMPELRVLLNSIERDANESPLFIEGKNGTWIEWYEWLKESSENSIKEIFVRYNHVDSKLIKILTRIENCMFFTQWNTLYNFEYDKTFGIYEIQIRAYLTHIKELEEYAEKNLKEYEYQTSEFVGFKPSDYYR